jgi:cathepsin X
VPDHRLPTPHRDTRYATPRHASRSIPHYCGSCWAHGALSSLADRIKIARRGRGVEINLSVQFILNVGPGVAGSCLGGSQIKVYELIHNRGGIPYDTCLPYEACSRDSPHPSCKQANYEDSAINTCRTCFWTTDAKSGNRTTMCAPILEYPNATVAEYGNVTGVDNMKAEIYARGPIACSVNAAPLDNYVGGILDDPKSSKNQTHVVSVVGWGTAEDGTEYWKLRNSWGEYWGNMGFAYLKAGQDQLGIESDCAWAVPGTFTEYGNYPCYEDGKNCATPLPAHETTDLFVQEDRLHM